MSASRMPVLRPMRLQAQRQIDGGGRLADAALAGGDRDHVLDAGDLDGVPRRRRAPAAASCRRRAPGARLLHPGAFRHRSASRRPRSRRAATASARLLGRQHGHDACARRPSRARPSRRPAAAAPAPRPLRRHGDRRRRCGPSLSRISDTSPRSTMLPCMSGPLTRRKRSTTWSLLRLIYFPCSVGGDGTISCRGPAASAHSGRRPHRCHERPAGGAAAGRRTHVDATLSPPARSGRRKACCRRGRGNRRRRTPAAPPAAHARGAFVGATQRQRLGMQCIDLRPLLHHDGDHVAVAGPAVFPL